MSEDKYFDITELSDWNDLPFSVNKSVGACLFGGPDYKMGLTLYNDEDWFYEAGVSNFGNAGDVTAENAYYWEKGEPSRYYNKGWMIWGHVFLPFRPVVLGAR